MSTSIATDKHVVQQISLDDKYDLDCRRIFASGSQALVRATLMQRALDEASGLDTAGYVSGYRGSPLGGLDQQFWKGRQWLEAAGVRFEPGLNEDLAATAILGSQQAAQLPQPKHDGVFGLWYGKGPGVDRAGDALKHANYAGSSKYGGVIAIIGDDHAGKSSTVAHQSEQAIVGFCMPLLYPATLQEYIDYALAGWAMSRYSGSWVGFKAVNETVESTGTIDVDPDQHQFILPPDGELPGAGIHVNLRYAPSEDDVIIQRYRLPRAQAFARANGLDRITVKSTRHRFGVVSAGKSFLDVCEALRALGIDAAKAQQIGLSVYKPGLVWPLEPNGLQAFASGLDEVMFIEEKRAFMEPQAAHVLFNLPESQRPRLVGKRDEAGVELLPSDLQLNAATVAQAIANRLDRLGLADEQIRARARDIAATVERAAAASGAALVRTPYFCSGCPHNRSTKVPDGSIALTGIGCHGMAALVYEDHVPPSQMGAEGATWIGASHFSNASHVFQNLGDGTYTHSGILAIRAAIAAGTNITYKVLYNDAVAMTGGQPAEGSLSVDQISRQLTAEGVTPIAVITDEPDKYTTGFQFASQVTIHDRRHLDQVQRDMRESRGVSAIIYDQTCAAEKRRRRKRGRFPDPAQRAFINAEVCEGCGDCSVQANCVSIQPLDTELGRKRVIDQSSCNKDFSCLEGFCPSFVTVEGGRMRKPAETELPSHLTDSLSVPSVCADENGYAILINGVGGTGVITIGAIIGMAAHLEGKSCSTFDMTGLSQKGGAVFSHVKVGSGNMPGAVSGISSPKVSYGEADLVLGCDLVVSAGVECLSASRVGKTNAVINAHLVPTGAFQLNPDLDLSVEPMHVGIEKHIGADKVSRVDATGLAQALLGDSIGANMLMLGYAAQKGLLPVRVASIEKALELNAIAVDLNRKALDIGRLVAHDPGAVSALLDSAQTLGEDLDGSLNAIIERRFVNLTEYQDVTYARRYRQIVDTIAARETAIVPGSVQLTRAVARYLFKLMAYKDEYEVARLHTNGKLLDSIAARFEGEYRVHFHLAPPILSRKEPTTGHPRKREFGPWVYRCLALLARLKGLRGTRMDVFGYSVERRMERQLRDDYVALLERIVDQLTPLNLNIATRLAEMPERIRGYGHVKRQHVKQAQLMEAQLWSEYEASTDSGLPVAPPTLQPKEDAARVI